ncbi:MAG TPA: sulfite exporter TauE/SafE family protein [Acidimicrobiia bacterium]|nr:sulfite exporter TauE/SafE family protein [Acidimicrobiia bacterium]
MSLLLVVLAGVTAALGALGGLGGAVILVPLLVLTGTPAREAAPLGLLSVASGSMAAGPRQLAELTVHHRLGVTSETVASAGAVAGAFLSGAFGESVLARLLAVVAAAAAVASLRGRDETNAAPVAEEGGGDLGEQRGTLSGTFRADGVVRRYQARNLPGGLAVMSLAGLVAGLAGASGGFIKTPATTEIMRVPVKVAAATTTFTIGITSAAALLVFAAHGRINLADAGPVIAGSLLGGQLGARLQAALDPAVIRRALAAVLVVVAVILFVQA